MAVQDRRTKNLYLYLITDMEEIQYSRERRCLRGFQESSHVALLPSRSRQDRKGTTGIIGTRSSFLLTAVLSWRLSSLVPLHSFECQEESDGEGHVVCSKDAGAS